MKQRVRVIIAAFLIVMWAVWTLHDDEYWYLHVLFFPFSWAIVEEAKHK